MTNAALRQFNIKIIKNKLNDLFWNPKNQQSKQKSNLNSSISKKNLKRVKLSESHKSKFNHQANKSNVSTTVKGQGRVECIEMIAKNRPTLPDVQT